jgi:hypothetical protein
MISRTSILRGEHGQKVIEKRVLREMFWPKAQDVGRQQEAEAKSLIVEFHRLCSSTDIIEAMNLEHWHVHLSDCRNTLVYAHTNSHTRDISLDSLSLLSHVAEYFVELILLSY